MNRRHFVTTAAWSAAASRGAASQSSDSAKAANTTAAMFELRYFYLRTSADNMLQRTTEFLTKSVLPAVQRAGGGPMGFFASVVAPDSPFIISLTSFPSLAGMEAVSAKLAADSAFQKEHDGYNAVPGLGYLRMESSLLRAFDSMPAIQMESSDAKHPPRLFELRMYESPNSATLKRKIKMFSDAEIGIFKRLGMQPIFFAETIVGRRMPNLVYMLAFEDLASRDKLWRAFGTDAEWQKLRSQPGLGDAEIVSNISNYLLRPLTSSPIR